MRMWKVSARAARASVVVVFMLAPAAAAQESDAAPSTERHQHAHPAPQQPSRPPEPASGQPVDHSQHQHPAPAGGIVDLPNGRTASGTGWLPGETPMYAVHGERGGWTLMAHGAAFLQYLREGGDRGGEQFGSINWKMGMARRPLGEGRLGLRGMVSVEPWTINGCGYPVLLASGEVCDGRAIVDQQHPHDFVMELAGHYDAPISDRLALQLYGGLAGEPALGPVAFPHRVSALSNPLAPLSHHWLDASHITFGVFTAGVYGRRWKAEGSFFNGREPDDERHDLDLDVMDSFSGRLWYLPTERLALQVSAGHLIEAEAGHDGGPRVDVDRLTASATYHRRFRGGGSIWASTVAWGRNTEEGLSTNFLIAETNVVYDEQDSWFGRVEVGGKAAHDLDLHGTEGTFTLGKLQAGYVRYLEAWNGLKPGVGATASISLVPTALEAVYGRRATFGFGLFVTLRPIAMWM